MNGGDPADRRLISVITGSFRRDANRVGGMSCPGLSFREKGRAFIIPDLMERPPDHFSEPFGQRGVLPYLWPTLVILCAIGFCTSIIMLQRAGSIWDTLSNTDSNRQLLISSVLDRLVFTIVPPPSNMEPGHSTWDFDSRNFDTIRDGWADGWPKTIGIQWGYELVPQANRPSVPYWRLRIRWRTLAFLYGTPVAIELIRRARRRLRRRDPAFEVVILPRQ